MIQQASRPPKKNSKPGHDSLDPWAKIRLALGVAHEAYLEQLDQAYGYKGARLQREADLRQVGVSMASLSQILFGKRAPSIRVLLRIAPLLNLDLEKLLRGPQYEEMRKKLRRLRSTTENSIQTEEHKTASHPVPVFVRTRYPGALHHLSRELELVSSEDLPKLLTELGKLIKRFKTSE